MPYFVYVIELEPEVAKVAKFRERNPGMGPDSKCYYVGQSVHEPDCRYRQHKECWGTDIAFKCICYCRRGRFTKRLSNSFARRFGCWLKRDLFEEFNPMRTREEAEGREAELARSLQAQGHGVWWG